ncbi:FAD/FMN-containing dehydrogenase [Pseudorhizobium halotolerans]|uniref:FAD/FMN-containing dehydrogenase n=1 Tax=Pseudorhizobium halotolerans TaxID=1233081 RepID=A0ABN7JFJ3_9HYPH|nr:FAD-binding protein [Pseudorhizobium halotolerans]CAD7026428.1 FAD/FMN-containing dehydrogenase [Pseudorhizobium halotolerans]
MTEGTESRGADAAVPVSEAELAALVADSFRQKRKLHICGGGTQSRASVAADSVLTTREIGGIVAYEPGALTLIVRTGASVGEIERLLATEGQSLAFEPMDYRVLLATDGTPTIGGMVGANLSGPRRIQAGACRDHLLGVRFVDGQGRIIRNGGRVMKNVTGMDLGKLLCGSHGTLGILTEVALKTLPSAEAQKTLVFGGLSSREAVAIFSTALATPFEVSGAAFFDRTAWLRIEGLSRQVEYRCERLQALFRGRDIDTLEDGKSRHLWRNLRDVRHFADRSDAVWRILVKPTEAPATMEALERLGGESSLDWGAALIWYCGNADCAAVRAAVPEGVVTLARPGPGSTGPAFINEAPGAAALAASLRNVFDPAGIFNPGRMGR